MIKEKINGAEIIFEEKYLDEKKIVKENYIKLSKIINDLWGFNKPENIKIFITDSDIKYSFYAYSFFQNFIILILFPFWYIKTRNSFKTIGVIDINAKYPSILIKSMKFMGSIESNVSGTIYKEFNNIELKYKYGYLSLLIRIRSDESKLPRWLGSGISSFTSEIFFSRNVVSKDTIEFLCLQNKNKDLNNYNTVYPHVLGYWTVRYLEENYPGFLKETFMKYEGEEIVERIRLKLGLSEEDFWEQLDELLYENYKHLLDNQ